MTQAQKLYTISSTRVFLRGCVFALFVTVLLAALPCTVKADMVLFWNFDEYTTEGGVNYVTDSVHSERLKLVNSSIVDGQLSANGGYAQGTVEGTNGVNVDLPTGSASYTLSAFLTSTTNATVGIMGWGAKSGGKCNCFRTTGNSGETTGGLNSYWWGNDIVVSGGYPEIYGGVENHVATTAVDKTHYIYLNGQLIGSGTKGARSEANQDFAVGKTVNNEQLKGSLDNASIYNEALEQSDIIRISTSKLNGLTNWWKSGTTVDRITGIVKPATVTGTTVITGANGDVMVFNRALEAGEQTFYQGQLATGHDYVINNMAGSESTKTTWLRASSANLSDASQTPLGIYVGGTTDAATLTATADQLNNVNRTLVLGGGTLAIASDSDVSIDKNRVGFDSGSISTSGNGTITLNSSEILSLKAINVGTNSALALNTTDDTRILGATSLGDNSSLTVNTVDLQILGATAIGANSSVKITASGSTQMNGAVSIGADSSLNIESSGNTRIGGVISGAGNLNKSGAGTLSLAGANTFSGDLTITAGIVEIARNSNSTSTTATALGNPSLAGRKITVKSGATLVSGAVADVFGGAEAHPLFTLVADGGTIATHSGYLTTYGDIELKNGGVFEDRGGHINGNSSWFTIFNGDISVTSGNASIQANSDGKGISLRGYRNGTNAGVKFDVAENSTLTVSALLKNCPNRGVAGSFTKTGKGTMILSNRNNDFTGNIVVDEGILKVQGGWLNGTSGTTVLGKNQARTITINKDGTLNFASQDVVTNADNTTSIKFIVNGGTITNEGAFFNNLSNAEFSNGGKIVATNGNGDWKAFMVNGTTKIAFAGDGNTAESPVVFEVASTATGTAKTNATICPQTTFDVADITKSDASDLIITAVLANASNRAGYFTKSGAGTMELTNNANSFTGNIVVNEGVLKASAKWTGVGTNKNTTVFGYYQSKTVTVNEGAEVILAAQDVVSDSSHSTPIQFILDGGKISNEGAVYNNLNNTVFKNGAELYASNGNGDWKAYKLSTKVSALRDKPSAQPAKITASTEGNATISFGHTTSLYVEDVTSASATELDTKSDLIISAKVTNPHNENNRTFYKDGVGTLEFTADNTFNGAVGIREGVLRLSGDGTLGSSKVTISDGATLEFLHTADKSFSNVFEGAGDIFKDGSGTLTFTGANTYTGETTIASGVLELVDAAVNANGPIVVEEAGTLEYNLSSGQSKKLTITDTASNTITGAGNIVKTGEGTLQICTSAEGQVDVNSFVVSSGRLDMKEYFKGTLEVGVEGEPNNNVIFSPGNSVGTLTIDGAFILNSGATLLIEQDASGMDQLFADSFTIAEDSVIELSMTSVAPGSTYAIAQDLDSDIAGVDFWNSLLTPESSYYWILSVDGNTLYATLNANAVPEPSTWALLILGVAGLMYWRRRK
ncbi:MAG: autotransporter-associated beta strand repeat-containing protein [Thermoguttaceae bacterium]|nr:autotransporter-associated beta strand repeat-containing protein [Thermoguttaceae bacterium]